MKTLRYWWLASIFVAFLLGLLCGSMFPDSSVQAAQTFGPDEVKSVPESFIKGGDRSAALLSEILTVLRENTSAVNKIESHTRNLRTQLKDTAPRGNDE